MPLEQAIPASRPARLAMLSSKSGREGTQCQDPALEDLRDVVELSSARCPVGRGGRFARPPSRPRAAGLRFSSSGATLHVRPRVRIGGIGADVLDRALGFHEHTDHVDDLGSLAESGPGEYAAGFLERLLPRRLRARPTLVGLLQRPRPGPDVRTHAGSRRIGARQTVPGRRLRMGPVGPGLARLRGGGSHGDRHRRRGDRSALERVPAHSVACGRHLVGDARSAEGSVDVVLLVEVLQYMPLAESPGRSVGPGRAWWPSSWPSCRMPTARSSPERGDRFDSRYAPPTIGQLRAELSRLDGRAAMGVSRNAFRRRPTDRAVRRHALDPARRLAGATQPTAVRCHQGHVAPRAL